MAAIPTIAVEAVNADGPLDLHGLAVPRTAIVQVSL
jgi:hypothetical protein